MSATDVSAGPVTGTAEIVNKRTVARRSSEVKPALAPVEQIRRLHSGILTVARATPAKAIRVGELLTGIKASLEHGEWLPWLKANVPFAERTARNYMRCHAEHKRLRSASVADLGETYRLLAAPAEPDESEIEAQRLADYARCRRFELRLNSPGLTIEDCVAIKNEATTMESYWRKVALEAECNLGAVLNEAEGLGIRDLVFAEVNRLLRESAQNSIQRRTDALGGGR